MTIRLKPLLGATLAVAVAFACVSFAEAQAQRSPRSDYQALLARERALTARGKVPTDAQLRALLGQYERFVGRHPRSGYSDNALWQGAQIANMLHTRSKRDNDRKTAKRLFEHLIREYPSSSLVSDAQAALRTLATAPPANAKASPRGEPARSRNAEPVAAAPAPTLAAAETKSDSPEPAHPTAPPAAPATAGTPSAPVASPPESATLRDIRRTVLPELVRVTLELDREVAYHDERLDGPPRVFFDLQATSAPVALADSVLTYPDDVVRQIRIGTHPDQTTRVVLDLDGAERYSIFTLYEPYRLVVDVFRRSGARAEVGPSAPAPSVTREDTATETVPGGRTADPAGPRDQAASGPHVASAAGDAEAATPARPGRAPEAPATTANGSFSLARQLGLGVARIVIDPGHGGHDPGALGKRVTEADLVLDIALRLEKLLQKNPAFDVTLTRRTDVFVPLEERTAIANRANADLFLSVHANASRNAQARGIETYFLNFASNPEAEAVAARENAASGRTMHNLPDIVKAIALNNKLDESREFARMVQGSLVKHVRGSDKGIRDLGVKQAPFVVLIGASMPSVLAEISFITNARDAQLLRSSGHRQKIAEALYEATLKYQRALKATETVAAQ